MKKNIFQILCIVLFFISFWYFFGDEYWEYQDTQEKYNSYIDGVTNNRENFSLDEISNLSGENKLHTLPDIDFLNTLVSEIDRAKKKIYVEVYIFTERDMKDALIRAHNRWVEVKILLENNPYMAPYLNDSHYQEFEEAGVNVKWSDPLNYSLNHSKLLIVDEKAYISTWNFSYSLFTKNRDFMLSSTDNSLVLSLEKLFLIDFNEEIGWIQNPAIVLSPYDSRYKITKLINSAETSIDFYFPYINDDEFKEVLFSVANKWINVRWIVEHDFFAENKEIISEFQRNNINISSSKTPKIHAKAVMVDKKYLYIWSINFSTYSFDENREIGVIVSDWPVISDFMNVFDSDF